MQSWIFSIIQNGIYNFSFCVALKKQLYSGLKPHENEFWLNDSCKYSPLLDSEWPVKMIDSIILEKLKFEESVSVKSL